MAFRMSDFGIPNYDTNVNVLYKNAGEQTSGTLRKANGMSVKP